MNGPASVAAVIVTYNRLDKLKNSLRSIGHQEASYIVVVNNNSSDQTTAWLAEQDDPRLQVINLAENTGGAGGFYTGIKHVVENTDANWALCFDDDAYPAEDAIEQFKQYYSNTDADIVSAAVYSMSGTIPEMNRPVRSMPTNLWTMLLYFSKRDDFVVQNTAFQTLQPIEIEASSFVGMFISTSGAREKFGYPREELFLYCDDLIYTYSASKNGALVVFDPRIRFMHDCNDQPHRLYHSPWKVYYLTRNYIELYRIANPRQYLLMSIARTIYIITKIPLTKKTMSLLINTILGLHHGIIRNFKHITNQEAK
jgi:rhamnopyranosyl-N-acetylglucosaminyl-diphospho-decaprenol beta-1,3/1,4-galactofuranosyltransferase